MHRRLSWWRLRRSITARRRWWYVRVRSITVLATTARRAITAATAATMARRDTIVAVGMAMVMAVGATTDRPFELRKLFEREGALRGPFFFPAALRHEALKPVPGNSTPC
ncbi:hypothetical protein D3C72_1671480 [compost metagenome]